MKKYVTENDVHYWIGDRQIYIQSSYSDGFSAFEKKKDLIRLNKMLTEVLESLPTFVGEEEYIAELELDSALAKLTR